MPRKKSPSATKPQPEMQRAPSQQTDRTEDFEKLGLFYLGRPYDLAAKRAEPGWLLYDSKDLVTHAVCVGMTGSGKTGLCLALLEEAAIDGIPAIIIDPKGDLGNLLLTFPNLTAEEFRPWINEDEAEKKGVSAEDYAEAQAKLWKDGLASWHQDGGRIRRLREAADFAIYTPGSNAGLPVSILRSFAAPASDVRQDREVVAERVGTTVTGLLGLLGVAADPIQSREHILLSTILGHAWRNGEDLDLASLIQAIQAPPVAKVGVLDIEAFFPAKDRFALAMKLNNLLAAPGFQTWMEGEALDIQRLLYGPTGKPRLAIFSIAHLNDAERMFFVTLLLSQLVGWMRAQSGTTSLRALLYMDEIFGYFPPVANPPSKLPLMTLLKQARAFGLGVVLATQNPVDLDYKGLANTGTWFIGRLQTERDKARVLEGLEGASISAGRTFSRGRMEQLLAGLGNRIFLMNNVHEDEPVVFETRWCLSYLRGPLTRNQIKSLMSGYGRTETGEGQHPDGSKLPSLAASSPPRALSPRPVLPPGVPQQFLPLRGAQPERCTLVYVPMVAGAGRVRFSDAKMGLDETQDVTALVPIEEGALPIRWDHAATVPLPVTDWEPNPMDGAAFLPVPAGVATPKSAAGWTKEFAAWLFRTQNLTCLKSPSTKVASKPGESERDFRIRLQQAAREQRDKAAEALRQKYAPRLASLRERVRRAEQTRERQQAESRSSQVQAAITVGASILGAFLGRKTISATNVGRATTAIRGAGRAIKEAQDVGHAEETVAALQRQLLEMEQQLKSETDAVAAAADPLTETLETLAVRPSKSDITVTLVALVWVPQWRDPQGLLRPAWR